jgi:ABC-type lipoprotein release transport system permease subunit
MYFLLGWRNIWRTPRRTLVIMIAIIIGIWSMIFLGALMRGIADQMVRNSIATLTGHVQVCQKGFRNDPVIENSMQQTTPVLTKLKELLPDGAFWTQRVRVNAVAGNARHSAGVTLVGIDPEREAEVSFIGKAVVQGHYLTADDKHGVLVGKALLDKFETRLGRKLVLMSQDTDREIASRAFRIVGVFRAEMEATEKQFAFITIRSAQQMLKMNESISEISVVLPDRKDVVTMVDSLRAAISSDEYEIYSWMDLLPLVTAILKLYDGSIFIWYLVVFIAMGFGIVNTTLMAVFERIREFGLLKALGMKPWWIIREVLTESCLILIIGMAIGNVLSYLSVLSLSGSGIDLSAFAEGLEYFGMSRIIYPVIIARDMVLANLVVFVLGILVSLYPAAKAARFTVVRAMAHT